MKKLFLSATVLAAIFMSCSKDDNPSPENKPDVDSTNTFGVDNKLFKTPYAWFDNNSTDPGELNLTSADLSTGKDTAVFHVVLIEVDTLIDGQTYTYHDNNTAGFDRKQHFSDAEFVYDAALADEAVAGGTGNAGVDVQSGSLTVHRNSENNFSFTYTLIFANNKKVVGNYNGVVRVTNN